MMKFIDIDNHKLSSTYFQCFDVLIWNGGILCVVCVIFM